MGNQFRIIPRHHDNDRAWETCLQQYTSSSSLNKLSDICLGPSSSDMSLLHEKQFKLNYSIQRISQAKKLFLYVIRLTPHIYTKLHEH